MNLAEIQAFYQYFNSTADEVGLVLYIVLDENGGSVVRLADIDDQSRLELKNLFLDSLAFYLLEPDLQYLPISQADARKNTLYQYDLAEVPTGLEKMSEVLADGEAPVFNFADDEFLLIKGFIITIGNDDHKIAIYKNHSHLNLLRGSTIFGMRFSNHRFERVRENILKLSKQIDFFQIGTQLFILNIKALERNFNFESIIRGKAIENIALIAAMNLLEDVSPLTEMIAELKNAKKVMSIRSNSPVMQVPVAGIIAFVQSYPPIMRKFRLSDDGLRLKLDTKVSKGLFLKLINDDLLTSTLTQQYYESLAKDTMVTETE